MLFEYCVELSWSRFADISVSIATVNVDPFAVDVVIPRDCAHCIFFATTCLRDGSEPFSSSVIFFLCSRIRNVTYNKDAVGGAMFTRKIGTIFYKLIPCIVVDHKRPILFLPEMNVGEVDEAV